MKKTIVPIVVTILIVLYYVVYFGFLISLLEGAWKDAVGIITLTHTIVPVF